NEDEKVFRQFSLRDSLFASSSQLYLHTDKSVYTGSENIWFSAYLLKAERPLKEYHTLNVFLSHRITHEIVASGKFVMIQGLAAGNIFIADTFPSGDYNLVAYTNAADKERNPQVFQQQISIRYGGGDPFTIELRDYQQTDSLRFLAKVTNKQLFNATGALFSYEMLGDNKLVKTGKMMVTPYGEVSLSMPSDSLIRKLNMNVIVNKEKTSLATNVPLSFLSNEISFRWYPESGDWVDGLPVRTPFEVTDRSGKSVAVKGQLLEDGVPVAKFSTAAGVGLIQVTPRLGKIYSVLLEDNNKNIIAARIPEVKAKGMVLNAAHAVVNDTLVVKLQSNGVGNRFFLLVHNYHEVYNFSPLQLGNSTAILRIPLDSLPVGLATVTVFDQALNPLAERTFFKGYDSLSMAQIKTDSTSYHRRSKVQLKIKLQDAKGTPLQGSFSLGASLTRRIDTTSFQDIVPYFYFREYEVMGIIPRIAGYGIGSKEALETLLLVRCWTRYLQPEKANVVKSVNWHRDLTVSGRVRPVNNKRLKKPIDIAVVGSVGLPIMTTDSSGYFSLSPNITALAPERTLHIVINEKNKGDFKVELNSEIDSLNKQLAGLTYPESEGARALVTVDEETLSKVKTLTNVIVKSSSKSEDRWANQGEFVSQTCNDYVCMNNILNCNNHRTGTPAVDGGLYAFRGGMIVYRCTFQKNKYIDGAEALYKIKGRYYSKDFYIADYAEFNPPDAEKLSTIYWSQQTVTDEYGEASISFYTNDLTGVFSVILQGISSKGVISGRELIRVID
ncbi:MAG: hypothetical protein J7527_11470, partial [Chitinophagaceae bacterium]|nr:hypothetical protein [Chitinophagaceae bacterium]